MAGFLKQNIQIVGVRNANLPADFIKLQIGIFQQISGSVNPYFDDKIVDGHTAVFLEQCAEIVLRKLHLVGDHFYGQLFIFVVF